ncbi:MAG TPA: methylmalonyl Co-A mutase-associated GTPase MeaB [Terracidiphilus sp.]|nr:methylmalonyl Co-A mutase-associated GTPase MeaB [Terracidiphilus sp.]
MKSALSERRGVAMPEAPRLEKPRTKYTREQYVEGILCGDRGMLARAITLIESARDADRELAGLILEDCLPHSGDSLRVGITGVPGGGKSSLIEALGRYLVEERGQKVAVLAVDPTSEISGGSILGDKTRMTVLAASESAFIRPSPTRGSYGGVAQSTREAMLLCEAAGYGNVLVETVGVGQTETAVRGMVDFFLLVTLAGAGDELQGMKRGVMELVDAVVVNKADGANVKAAEKARSEIENALHLFAPAASGWTPRVLTCSARTCKSIRELWSVVEEHAALTRANGWREAARTGQQRQWMRLLIEQGLRKHFESNPQVRERIAELERDVVEGRTTSFRAAQTLLSVYLKSK